MSDSSSALLRRQKILADFGDFALQSEDLDEVLAEACRLVGEALETDRAKVLEIERDGESLLVRAGVGWAPDVVGLRIPMGERTSESYSIRAGQPVITQDIGREDRFEVPDFMKDAGVVAMVNVPVFLPGRRPYGLLQVDDTEPRDFDEADTEFLRTYATILGPVIDRLLKVRALRSSEERFRLTVETATDYAIFVIDAEGCIADWLPGAAAVFGWRAEEIVGQPVSVLFTPEDREAGVPEQEVETARAQGSAPDVRWHLRKDGSRVFIEGVMRALHDPRGAPQGFIKIGQDVTARREADAKLRANEERQAFLLRLADALRPLTDPVEIQGEAARLLRDHYDAGWCYYIEWDEAGIFGTVLRDSMREGLPSMVGLHDGTSIPEVMDLLRAGLLNVADFAAFPLFSPSIVERYTSIGMGSLLSPSLVKNGRLMATFSLADTAPREWSDDDVALVSEVAERTWAVVEQARAEVALREGEERFRSFAEASSDVLWIVDAETRQLEYLSPAYERIWGEGREGVLADIDRWTGTVHPEDRDQAGGALDAALKGQRLAVDYRIRRPDQTMRYIYDTGFPILGEDGRVRRAGGIAQDITERRLAELAREESEGRLRVLMEGIPQLVWRSSDLGEWTWASPQWLAFTGQEQEQSHGRGWLDALHPDDREAALQGWEDARSSGMLDVEYRVRRASDGAWIWHHSRSIPVHDAESRIVEWLGTSTDVQALKQFQERQEVMVAELQHRTRNLITVVRSIANQTMASKGPSEAFQRAFNERMAALARVQGLLSRSGQEPITLRALLRLELDALGAREGERVALDGPPVRLRPSIVQTLALALHELATNARKYGVLSERGGRLGVRWSLRQGDEGRRLHIEWREEGLNPAEAEAAEPGGYGRRLIERALPYTLKARTTYELGPEGLRCIIDLPLDRAGPTART